MLAVIILAALVTALIYPSFIRSGQLSRQEEAEEEFEGYINCDKDCYICGSLEQCKREVAKEG